MFTNSRSCAKCLLYVNSNSISKKARHFSRIKLRNVRLLLIQVNSIYSYSGAITEVVSSCRRFLRELIKTTTNLTEDLNPPPLPSKGRRRKTSESAQT